MEELSMNDVEAIARSISAGNSGRKPKKATSKKAGKPQVRWMELSIEEKKVILESLKRDFENLAIPKGGHYQTILFEGQHVCVGYSIRYLHLGLIVIIGGDELPGFAMELPVFWPSFCELDELLRVCGLPCIVMQTRIPCSVMFFFVA